MTRQQQRPKPKHHDRPVCPTSGKQSFRSEKQAQLALVSVAVNRDLFDLPHRREQRYYLCEHCSTFHLTSRPLRLPAYAGDPT